MKYQRRIQIKYANSNGYFSLFYDNLNYSWRNSSAEKSITKVVISCSPNNYQKL